MLKKYGKRRREMFCRVVVLLSCIHTTQIRKVWMHRRTAIWYELVTVLFSDGQWYKNFWVTRATFTFILEEICEQISRRDTEIYTCWPSTCTNPLLLGFNGRIQDNCTSVWCFDIFGLCLHKRRLWGNQPMVVKNDKISAGRRTCASN